MTAWFVALGLLQLGLGVLTLSIEPSAPWAGYGAIGLGASSLIAALLGFGSRMRETMVPMGFFFVLEAFWLLLLARRVAPILAWATFMLGLAYLFAMVATDSGAPERPGLLGREPRSLGEVSGAAGVARAAAALRPGDARPASAGRCP